MNLAFALAMTAAPEYGLLPQHRVPKAAHPEMPRDDAPKPYKAPMSKRAKARARGKRKGGR